MVGTSVTPLALVVSLLLLGATAQDGTARRHAHGNTPNVPGQPEAGKPHELLTLHICLGSKSGEDLCGTFTGVISPRKGPKPTSTQKPPMGTNTPTTLATSTKIGSTGTSGISGVPTINPPSPPPVGTDTTSATTATVTGTTTTLTTGTTTTKVQPTVNR